MNHSFYYSNDDSYTFKNKKTKTKNATDALAKDLLSDKYSLPKKKLNTRKIAQIESEL